jgi:hypothetical protein
MNIRTQRVGMKAEGFSYQQRTDGGQPINQAQDAWNKKSLPVRNSFVPDVGEACAASKQHTDKAHRCDRGDCYPRESPFLAFDWELYSNDKKEKFNE